MPGTQSTAWRRRFLAGSAALILPGLLVAGYLGAPWLVSALAPRLAEPLGLERLAVDIARPQRDRLHVLRAEISVGALDVSVTDATLRFRLRDLLRGRLAAVDVARMQLHVAPVRARQGTRERTGSGGGPRTREAPQTHTALPTPQVLLDALPAERVRVAVLEVAVPHLGFAAAGRLDADRNSVSSTLQGIAPEPARAFALVGSLEREGVLRVALVDRESGGDGGPHLTAVTEFVPQGLALTAQADLRGYSLQLVTALLGLPEGDGRASARLESRLPWPLPRTVAWDALNAHGELDARWAAATVAVEVAPLTAHWQLDRGRVSGALTVQSRIDARGVGGALTAHVDAESPWPLSPDTALDGITASAQVSGHFHGSGGNLSAGPVRAQAHLSRGRLTLEATGRTAYSGHATDVALHVDPVPLDPSTREIDGTLALGALRPARFSARIDPGGASTVRLTHRQALAQPLAAGLIAGWSAPGDLDAGTLDVDVRLGGTGADDLTGTVRVALADADAHYGDYRVEGLSGAALFMAEGGAWRLAPSSLRAARLDAGVVVTDLAAGLDGDADRLRLYGLDARLLGGRARATPFTYAIETESAAFVLSLEGLSLTDVLALEGEHVSGRGTIDGTLPVRMEAGRPMISGGKVAARPPGGVIRLSRDITTGTGQPGLDFALTALRDFRFDALAAEVDYGRDGELALGVRLEGRNPEVEQGRAIHYNLNITENVPVLLESLRLQDRVTRGIERRVRDALPAP